MVDYSKLTTEAFENKINSSSDRVKKFFNSEESVKRISEISDTHHFDLIEREYLAFHKLAAATILGFINPNELPEEILKFIDTDMETATSATKDIKGLITELSNTEFTNTPTPNPQTQNQTPSPAPQLQEPNLERPDFSKVSDDSEIIGQTPKQEPETKPHKIKDYFAPKTPAQKIQTKKTPQQSPTPTIPKAPEQVYKESANVTKEKEESEDGSKTPFVLQEEDEVRSNIETDVEASKPIRASFYKSKPTTETKKEASDTPATAKIEFGNTEEEEPKKVDYVVHLPNETEAKTGKETGPVRESSKYEKSETPEESNSDSKVHPENIVDLKDLPR